MGTITKFMIAIVLVIFISGLYMGMLYNESEAPDKTQLSINTSIKTDIENRTYEIQRILSEDTVADPNDPIQLANYFSKTLAILGQIVGILVSIVTSSIEFIQSLLLNISNLPAPFNILGQLAIIGVVVYTIFLIMKLAGVFLKVEI